MPRFALPLFIYLFKSFIKKRNILFYKKCIKLDLIKFLEDVFYLGINLVSVIKQKDLINCFMIILGNKVIYKIKNTFKPLIFFSMLSAYSLRTYCSSSCNNNALWKCFNDNEGIIFKVIYFMEEKKTLILQKIIH